MRTFEEKSLHAYANLCLRTSTQSPSLSKTPIQGIERRGNPHRGDGWINKKLFFSSTLHTNLNQFCFFQNTPVPWSGSTDQQQLSFVIMSHWLDLSKDEKLAQFYYQVKSTFKSDALIQGWPNHCLGAKKCPPRHFQVPFEIFWKSYLLNSIENFATIDWKVKHFRSWNCFWYVLK